MIKREFKARMVDDFVNRWLQRCAIFEGTTVEEVSGWYDYPDFREFANRVSGSIVTITENEYPSCPGSSIDYFEKINNDFVLWPELFKEIEDIKDQDLMYCFE